MNENDKTFCKKWLNKVVVTNAIVMFDSVNLDFFYIISWYLHTQSKQHARCVSHHPIPHCKVHINVITCSLGETLLFPLLTHCEEVSHPQDKRFIGTFKKWGIEPTLMATRIVNVIRKQSHHGQQLVCTCK